MPVVWIEVPPVLVDQALKLWAEKDVVYIYIWWGDLQSGTLKSCLTVALN